MDKNILSKVLQTKILVFDGAMGTMLQSMAPSTNCCAELHNIENVELVYTIHKKYVDAGCDVIETNTLGANRIKLEQFSLSQLVKEINSRAVEVARRAASNETLIAGDMGPTGKFLEPMGRLSFDEVYRAYFEQAKILIESGVDLINIETMTDLHEAKIAVIAVKDAGDIPIICSMTYDQNYRTLTGANPETVATVLESLNVDIIGVNCGFGPEMTVEIVKRIHKVTDRYISAQPNAGMPKIVESKAKYSLGPFDMQSYAEKLVSAGANIIGGCCGTTEKHMKLIVQEARKFAPKKRKKVIFSKLASGSKTIFIGDKLVSKAVGERINPSGNQRIYSAVINGEFNTIANEAKMQESLGASIIDVNMSVRIGGKTKESDFMCSAVCEIQKIVTAPLSIDTISPKVMEDALKIYRGKALLNSTSGKDQSLEDVLSIAKKYGTAFVGLTLDDNGIPETAKERLKIAEKIIDRAYDKGIRKDNIFIDALVLTAASKQDRVLETIKTVKLIKQEFGVRTLLGISNISFGLPNRSMLNATFLAICLEAGLDLPIINPLEESIRNVIRASDVLTNRDVNAREFIALSHTKKRVTSKYIYRHKNTVHENIIQGDIKNIVPSIKKEEKKGLSAKEIIDAFLIPALEEVGEKFEKQEFFLPQLMMSAETAEIAFEYINAKLDENTKNSKEKKRKILLATVEGDVHDIGKNIVAIMLKNYGFNVVDLGTNVKAEIIVERALEEKPNIIGVSALMTTTMQEIETVANKLRESKIEIPLIIGGAVVTKEFATSLGAFYAKDAVESVKVAKSILTSTVKHKTHTNLSTNREV
ncbi:MAG: homocysteine methyltransferase [Alkaliphilus sp.]|nr:homocysteine S-methyltransferase family protein [bacterium AH-315-G05]PHS35941.1 MAG: homocysteine methyltransferase [Alkaliphilus sp.]